MNDDKMFIGSHVRKFSSNARNSQYRKDLFRWGIQNTIYASVDTVTSVIRTARPYHTVTSCTLSTVEIDRPNGGWTGL